MLHLRNSLLDSILSSMTSQSTTKKTIVLNIQTNEMTNPWFKVLSMDTKFLMWLSHTPSRPRNARLPRDRPGPKRCLVCRWQVNMSGGIYSQQFRCYERREKEKGQKKETKERDTNIKQSVQFWIWRRWSLVSSYHHHPPLKLLYPWESPLQDILVLTL